jgi:hypothetical protein
LFRDGVLLCHLLHSIDPASIDMKLVNQKPALAQFLCLKNIRYCTGPSSAHRNNADEDL